jgi:hypothetical protein
MKKCIKHFFAVFDNCDYDGERQFFDVELRLAHCVERTEKPHLSAYLAAGPPPPHSNSGGVMLPCFARSTVVIYCGVTATRDRKGGGVREPSLLLHRRPK